MDACISYCDYCCYYCWCPTKHTETPQADLPVNPRTHSPLYTTPSPPPTFKKPPPTLKDVTSSFEKIDITIQADVFITALKQILDANTVQNPTQDEDKLSMLHSLIQSGGKFLKFVNNEIEKMKTNDELTEATRIVGDTLKAIGDVHWAVAGLSIVGYLVSKGAKMSQNRTECLEILQEMLTLVSHIKDFNILIKEEKENFENAFRHIIEGSICCASQLDSGKFFSFLKASLNSEKLSAIRSQISRHYRDLNMAANKKLLREKTITKEILPQGYPSYAV